MILFGIHNMEADNEFCPNCKNILPPIGLKGTVECYLCKTVVPVQATKKLEYVIHFNSLQNTVIVNKETTNNEALGPIVERKCPKCGNNEMSYATVQLRSADEGQTVFFTCTKCKYTESENS